MSTRFQILSLSGGGYLGLYTVAVLGQLEAHKRAPIGRSFDLIAGTSIGGIVALGIAGEIPIRQIQSAFEKNGIQIFSDRRAPRGSIAALLDLRRFATKPKYKADALRQTIADLVGEKTSIGDLKHPVIVPTLNLTKGRPQIFKTPHHSTFKIDLHRRVVDVAMATSAAPTYFPLAEIDDCLYADGGLYANSPDILATHEAQHFFKVPEDDMYILSIGTTTSQYSLAHANGRHLGLIGWVRDQRLVRAMISSQQQSVEHMMRHRFRDRYLRLDAEQSRDQTSQLGLDVATEHAQSTIRGLANATVQSWISNPLLAEFLQHLATPPQFYKE